MPQGSHLDDTLAREDGYEEQVDLGQDVDLLRALVICLHHHGHHIQQDEKHDDDVKGLLGHDVEYEALVPVLKGGAKDGLSSTLGRPACPLLLPLGPDRPPLSLRSAEANAPPDHRQRRRCQEL